MLALSFPLHLWLFVLSAVALLLVPGQSLLYLMTRSVAQGRRVGLLCVVGLACGTLMHVTFSTLGLYALLASSAPMMELLRFGGVAYLIGLGLAQWCVPRAAGPPS